MEGAQQSRIAKNEQVQTSTSKKKKKKKKKNPSNCTQVWTEYNIFLQAQSWEN